MRVSIPEELRHGLRAIASGAVAVAQERYRDHLDETEPEGTSLVADHEAISISRDWPAILSVVDDVLGHDPGLRDRLLLQLSNADPEDLALSGRA